MGEGKNFGKGQTRRTGARGTRTGARRVRGEKVTREPAVMGMRGEQGRSQPGGGKPVGGRGAGYQRDMGGEPSEAPLGSSTRPDESPVGDFGASDELEQGF